MRIAIVILAAALSSAAQDIKFPPGLEKLDAKSGESVNLNLEGPALAFASRVLSDKDPDQAKAKKIISNLKGIYIRSFEFDKEGEYNPTDIDAFRAQLQSPTWSRMVGVRSKSENAEVYFKLSPTGDMDGLVVIAVEPKELTIVNIVGTIRPEDIAELSGQFGIPKLQLPGQSTPKKKAPKKEDAK